MFKRYLKIGAFLLVCCCGSQSHSEVPDLPPKNVLEIPDADPWPTPTMIGKSWTPEQQQLMNDLKNRLILLHHKFRRLWLEALLPQQGHRGKIFISALITRTRMVAIEFAMWRSGRKGGSPGSITVG